MGATRQPLENGISNLTKTASFQVFSDSLLTVARRYMDSDVDSVVKRDIIKTTPMKRLRICDRPLRYIARSKYNKMADIEIIREQPSLAFAP